MLVSTLLYDSEVCAIGKSSWVFWKNITFCKRILTAKTIRTPYNAIFIELGRLPISVIRKQNIDVLV